MRNVICLIMVLGCFGLFAHSSMAVGTIEVDFSGSSTAVTHRASGFIAKFDKNYPSSDFVNPTKPQLIRGGIDNGYFHDMTGAGTALVADEGRLLLMSETETWQATPRPC